jgi:hypothetical protein
LEIGKDGIDSTGIIDRMIEFANVIREMNKKQGIVHTCSTRQLIQWGNLCRYLSIKEAATISILNKADKDERAKIKDELDKFFKHSETLKKHINVLKDKKKKEAEVIANKITDNTPVTASSGASGEVVAEKIIDYPSIEEQELSGQLPF